MVHFYLLLMSNHTIQEAAFVKEARVHVNESLTIPETVPGGTYAKWVYF